MVIEAFFNGTKTGDTFQGLNDSIKGRNAGRIISGLSEFLSEAGRDYFIRKVPAFQRLSSGDFAEIEGQFSLARSSDEKIVSPHTVTGQYCPLSLLDLAEEVNPWVAEGWATPDGVYSTDDGSLEVLSLRLDAGDIANMTDGFRHYAILENPHARGGKAKGKIISWRIVCANTFAMAIGAASDFTIGHRMANGSEAEQTAIMSDRKKLAVETWENLRTHVRKLSERIDTLKSAQLTLAEAEKLTDRLLRIDGTPSDDVSTRTQNRKDSIMRAFNFPQFGTEGRTAFDWINGVTFDISSPFNPRSKVSKVSGLSRMLQNVSAGGVGFDMEARANAILAELVA